MPSSRSYFCPDDIAFMYRVLGDWCVTHHVERDSHASTLAAITLIRLMQDSLTRDQVVEALARKSASYRPSVLA